MITTLIAKFAAPALIGVALGVGGVVGIQRATKQDIKVEVANPSQATLDMIAKRLGDLEKSNSIEIEKMKNFKGTFIVHQHYHVEMKGDSTIVNAIGDEVHKRMNNLKLSRCK
jgi:hypothetical protein